MGFDVQVRQCATPLREDCRAGECSHKVVDETYLSYNFSQYKDYWFIKKHLHQHRGKTLAKSAEYALERLKDEGIVPYVGRGEDMWTASKGVFAYHLERFKKMGEKYYNHRFYADCCREEGYLETDTESIYSFTEEDEYSILDDYLYYTDSSGYKTRVDNFQKAAEIYTRLCLEGDSTANIWLDVARSMSLE